MVQKHLLKLDNCTRDNALQYIVVRARKKAFSLYLMHEKQGEQHLLLLTKIQRSTLNFHRPGQLEAGKLDTLKKILLQNARQELAIVTEIEKRPDSRQLALEKWKSKKSQNVLKSSLDSMKINR